MSRTLFWYILRDLLRVFLLTTAVLAGILAFGGLLKPMTEHGLSAGQAALVLLYFLPATQTYALPIAALFATTMVYGRLAADNELTACRASGISHLSLALPALVLGLVLAIASLLCLCFVSPHYMLKAEKVVFSNLAEVVKRKIDRMHQVQLGGYTVYANSADVEPTPPGSPDQIVTLRGVVFVSYESGQASQRMDPPSVFWTADSATAFIRSVGDEVEFRARLTNGMKIDARDGAEGAMGEATFGPISVSSPIRERTQFMNVDRLKELRAHPERSRKVRDQFHALVRSQMERQYLRRLAERLQATGICRLESDEGEFALHRADARVELTGDELTLRPREPGGSPQVQLVRRLNSRTAVDRATEASVQVAATADAGRRYTGLRVAITLRDAILDGGAEDSPRHDVFRGRRFTVPLPPDLAAIQDQSIPALERTVRDVQMRGLKRDVDALLARVVSEIHGRASFSISCLILVMIGCALGMMFRSGDFLTAFALSAVPALLTIALISTGQRIGEDHKLSLGIALIWAGNAAILVLAGVLLRKLQRQ